ncbi:MAG TPA: DNA N-6-adenine-methyltransferase [Gemmatimonadales bacterium]|nr:DNA N-6-adenine-methyltransferase [Gemmatimonadales bacterium]
MPSRALFTSLSADHATPVSLYAALHTEFRFTLDPCPLGGLRLEHSIPYGSDGLKLSWAGQRVFCNPPYGKGVAAWLEKAREAELAVYLLPARTDTYWFHTYALQADEIRFLRGRLNFGDRQRTKHCRARATFPSLILVYRS